MKIDKKQKRILKLILIIVIFIVVLIVALHMLNLKENTIQDGMMYDDTIEISEINYPYMGYKFFQYYKGRISSDDIAKSMSEIAENVIPEYYNKLKGISESRIERFYEENAVEILDKLGISDFQSFSEFIDYICNFNSDTLVYKSYRIVTDSFSKDSDYSYCYLAITYEGENELEIKVGVNNKVRSNNPDLIYTVR